MSIPLSIGVYSLVGLLATVGGSTLYVLALDYYQDYKEKKKAKKRKLIELEYIVRNLGTLSPKLEAAANRVFEIPTDPVLASPANTESATKEQVEEVLAQVMQTNQNLVTLTEKLVQVLQNNS